MTAWPVMPCSAAARSASASTRSCSSGSSCCSTGTGFATTSAVSGPPRASWARMIRAASSGVSMRHSIGSPELCR